jgi:hypothetical protein
MERQVNMDAGWRYDAPTGTFKNPIASQALIDMAAMRTGRTPEMYMPFIADNLEKNGYVEFQVLPPDVTLKPGGRYVTQTRRVMVREFGIAIEMRDTAAMGAGMAEKPVKIRLLEHMENWLTAVYAWTLLPELRRTAVEQVECACGRVLSLDDYGRTRDEHMHSCVHAQARGMTLQRMPGRMVCWYGMGFLQSEWAGMGDLDSLKMLVPDVLPIGEAAYMTSKPDTCLIKHHAPGCICATLR